MNRALTRHRVLIFATLISLVFVLFLVFEFAYKSEGNKDVIVIDYGQQISKISLSVDTENYEVDFVVNKQLYIEYLYVLNRKNYTFKKYFPKKLIKVPETSVIRTGGFVSVGGDSEQFPDLPIVDLKHDSIIFRGEEAFELSLKALFE